MPTTWIVNERIPRHHQLFVVLNKTVALLGLVALAFLLTRPVTKLRVGSIMFVVVLIQITLSYSPKRESAVHPVAVRSMLYRDNQSRGHLVAKVAQKGKLNYEEEKG